MAQIDENIDSVSIYFDHDQFDILEKYHDDLKQIADALLNSKGKIIHIYGFTDHTGSNAYNRNLSLKRAEAVKNKLIQMGIPPNLIERVEGKGELPALDTAMRIPHHRRVGLKCINRKLFVGIDTLDIQKMTVGDYIILENLHFKPGKPYLLKSSKPQLDHLLQFLKTHTHVTIELQGHVCCSPNHQDGYDIINQNHHLSKNRAQNLYHYLINQGIDSIRLAYRGMGRSKPLYPNELTEKEKMMNRRVEVKITGFLGSNVRNH